MNLQSIAKSFSTPGTLRSVLAGVAVTWGTSQAGRIAQQAIETTQAAQANYAAIVQALKERQDELETLESQRVKIVSDMRREAVKDLTEGLATQIEVGNFDDEVTTRASVLGWVAPVIKLATSTSIPIDIDISSTENRQMLAECGQPYPCGHAPDGGEHPVNAAMRKRTTTATKRD